MDFRLGSRAVVALAALGACGAVPSVNDSAAATTPPLAWQNLREIRVLCLVATDRPTERLALQQSLCERVRELAAQGAPMPVKTVGFGDPAILDRDTATLLVHASAEDASSGRQLLFTMRPFRAGEVDTAILFGAAPRAVTLTDAGAPAPALDAALGAALAETLPWRGAR